MKKIIITGVPRSGTTVISNLLSMSPKIVITPELGLFDNGEVFLKNRIIELSKHSDSLYHQIDSVLKYKKLTLDDMIDFLNGNFDNKGDLEFFGDKWPTYCTLQKYCSSLVENHQDAYFIFTHRDPCATIYSRLHRSKNEKFNGKYNKNMARDWYVDSIPNTTKKFIEHTKNWLDLIFPNVKNKIIIKYEDYVNNLDLLTCDLENFLNTSLNLPDVENMINFSSIKQDVGYKENRKLYESSTVEKYKEGLTQDEINYIREQTEEIDLFIKNLTQLKL